MSRGLLARIQLMTLENGENVFGGVLTPRFVAEILLSVSADAVPASHKSRKRGKKKSFEMFWVFFFFEGGCVILNQPVTRQVKNACSVDVHSPG